MKFIANKFKSLVFCTLLSTSLFMVGCSKNDSISEMSNSSSTDLTERNGAPAPGNQPIAQIAINAGFSELVSALSYVDSELNTGLVNLFLNGTDQYTVFAPTNAAFQNLYTALNVNNITDLPAELVRDVLFYHVVEGRRAANSVVPKNGTKRITTLLQVGFTINPQGQISAVGNTANITSANISASNGIIHVIDAVILPIN